MRLIRRVIAALLLLILVALVTGWIMLRGSLPRLDGAESLAGLNAEVTVERDIRGIPTIHASNREDLAYALGFLHAQDRFFQMDLLRREAGGELSELLGSAALPLDRDTRRHRFRNRAAQTLQQFDAAEKRQLDAYVLGVNAGLAALSVRAW